MNRNVGFQHKLNNGMYKLKNNKINKEESLFPNQMMIPPGKGMEKCSCGNLFDSVTLESRNPVIHHSKPTHDSRTGLLSVHFLETSTWKPCRLSIFAPIGDAF